MKFSYTLLKKLVPGLKNKQQVIDALNMHAFEAADLGKDTIDVSIYPNRFSDAASHFGLAQELSAILNLELKLPKTKLQKSVKNSKKFSVTIRDKNLCPRYIGQYFENVKVGQSPKWMQDILKNCGLRPINNIVDITNYVMLEIGEPMHAFDYDKLTSGSIIIRRAEKGEKIITLDNEAYKLDSDVLVIADSKNPLAIAGIKGGKKAEITKDTKRIILEAANFDGVNIYKTHKAIGLVTDAAVRFSHNISSVLPVLAINRGRELLEEIADAKPGEMIDVLAKSIAKKVIRFDVEKFNKLIGVKSDATKIIDILKRLGFNIVLNSRTKLPDSFLVEVPPVRTDVEIFEDLAEEVARIIGYNNLRALPPYVHLSPSGFEDEIVLKDKIRNILMGLGLDEVYNYSFSSQKNGVELLNPIAEDKKYLRPSLISLLAQNITDNFRFLNEVKIFEIGKVFTGNKNAVKETLYLGLAVGHKNKKVQETFSELKGMIEELFKRIGLVDFTFGEGKDRVEIYSNNETIGWAEHEKNANIAEMNLEKILEFVEEEFEYEPLSKFPAATRDISVLVKSSARIGDIMQEIESVDPILINDIDLIDEYEGEHFEENKKSLTFRIVFQHKDRTLTDKEVDEKMARIHSVLSDKFNAQIR
ncbi:MAG: phenylalanine--tRNA ligase subunit beta [Candidatus Paceibacterota bacterium]|jgi:phenylalanyl-tRNA synthetase beta chain